MFPYTTLENLLLVALSESKQAKHSHRLLKHHRWQMEWCCVIINNRTLVCDVYILLLKLWLYWSTFRIKWWLITLVQSCMIANINELSIFQVNIACIINKTTKNIQHNLTVTDISDYSNMAFTIMQPKVKHLRMLNIQSKINILCFFLCAL
jgi:hypothetical protein